MSKPGRFRKPADVLLQDLDGEAVLLHLANGRYYGLDKNSFQMYKTLLARRVVEEAYEALSKEYAVEPERLKIDLEKFVMQLLENGLIVYADQSTE